MMVSSNRDLDQQAIERSLCIHRMTTFGKENFYNWMKQDTKNNTGALP
jgi:hypothetical protein